MLIECEGITVEDSLPGKPAPGSMVGWVTSNHRGGTDTTPAQHSLSNAEIASVR